MIYKTSRSAWTVPTIWAQHKSAGTPLRANTQSRQNQTPASACLRTAAEDWASVAPWTDFPRQKCTPNGVDDPRGTSSHPTRLFYQPRIIRIRIYDF